jgi:hypothetical protein
MAAITNYYGKSKYWKTYLEIYSKNIKSSEKTIHRQLTDQDAYDTWHLSFYTKEILSYKRLLAKKSVQFDELPRKEKNLLLYILLTTFSKKVQLVELGHSLFELIDGFEVVHKYFQKNKKIIQYPFQTVSFFGIDISDDLCLTSELLHQNYKVKTVHDVLFAPKKFDILYDRNVSSYAFTKEIELAEFINRSTVALMNLFVSKTEAFASLRLGKTLTYFSLPKLLKYLDKPLYHLFGERSPGPFQGKDLGQGKDVVEGFFLSASEKQANTFIQTALTDVNIGKYFKDKNIMLTPANQLISK